jgi:hypothetical protein
MIFFTKLFSLTPACLLPWSKGFFGISAGTALAIGGVAAAGATVYSASQNRVAGNKALDAIAKNKLNIDDVITSARDNAAANLEASIALERKYLPGTAALRLQADQGLSDLAKGNTAGLQARDALLKDITSVNPLLKASTDSILKQLQLGGKLDSETQAAVAKAALEQGGSAGISGSGASRGLVARDIGTTSLALQQARTAAGVQGGQILASDFAQRLGLAGTAAAQDQNIALSIASLISGRSLPDSGISSGSLVDLLQGQNNAENNITAQRYGIEAANNSAMAQAFSQAIGGITAGYASGASGGLSSLFGSNNSLVSGASKLGYGTGGNSGYIPGKSVPGT